MILSRWLRFSLISICLIWSGAWTSPAARADDPNPPHYRTTFAYFPLMVDGVDYRVPLVQVRLNDKITATFVIDTGTDSCLITDTLAQKLGIKPKPLSPAELRQMTDPSVKDFVPTPVTLGDFRIPNIPLVVIPEERFAFTNEHIDGILGNNILSLFSVLFDFTKHQITLTSPGGATAEDLQWVEMNGATVVPFTDPGTEYRDLVHVQLSQGTQKIEEDLLLDTGAPKTHISPSDVQHLGLVPTGAPQDLVSFYGKQAFSTATLETLTLGPLVLTNLQVDYNTNKTGAIFPPVLGLNVLANYRVLVDYVGKKMYLKSTVPVMQAPVIGPVPPAPAGPTGK